MSQVLFSYQSGPMWCVAFGVSDLHAMGYHMIKSVALSQSRARWGWLLNEMAKDTQWKEQP